MRPQQVDDQTVLAGLMSVLRSKGYDGASLNDLAEATGLQKASLYHRFKGGKVEMTRAVLSYTQEWVKKHIFDLLHDYSISPENRLEQVIQNIDALYQGGEAICILRALSMDTGIELFGEQIQQSMQTWIQGFTTLGLAFGLYENAAKDLATQTLIQVEGSLIVAKGMNNNTFFKATLESIKNSYLKK